MALRTETTPGAAPARGGGRGRVYAGQTAEERDADRRERLLTTIHDIVGTHGYAALTVERLCASANVSTRSFYQLYDGKESAFADLYDALLNRSSERVLNSLIESEELARPMKERVPLAFWAFVGPMLRDLRTARITFVEVVGLSPRIEATRLRTRSRLIELIETEGRDAVARGEVADRDFHFAALALIGAATAIAQDWLIRTHRPPMDRLERQLTDLAIQLLTA